MAQRRREELHLTLGELPKEARATATPDAAPSGTDVPKLGLTLAPAGLVAGSGSEGVVVTAVDPDGLASEHGLKTGDVILDVGGKKIAKPARRARRHVGSSQSRKTERADAAEVGRYDALRCHSDGARLT